MRGFIGESSVASFTTDSIAGFAGGLRRATRLMDGARTAAAIGFTLTAFVGLGVGTGVGLGKGGRSAAEDGRRSVSGRTGAEGSSRLVGSIGELGFTGLRDTFWERPGFQNGSGKIGSGSLGETEGGGKNGDDDTKRGPSFDCSIVFPPSWRRLCLTGSEAG